jgi:WD40 repeat protein
MFRTRLTKTHWLFLLFGISCLLNVALVMVISLRRERQTIVDQRRDAADPPVDASGGLIEAKGSARVVTAGLPVGFKMILRGHSGPIRALSFAPDQSRLGVTTEEGYITVWNLAARKVDWEIQIPGSGQGYGVIDALAFSPHGDQLTYAVREESTQRDSFAIHIRDLEMGREKTLRDDDKSRDLGGCMALSFSPDGRTLAVGGRSGIALFSLKDGKVVGTLSAEKHLFYLGLHYSADGAHLLAATWPRAALFDLASGKISTDFESVPLPYNTPEDLALSPDLKRIAIGGLNNAITLCDARNGRVLTTIKEGLGSGWTEGRCWVAFASDKRSILTASRDNDGSRIFVRRRNSEDGSLVSTLEIVQPGGTIPHLYPRLFTADGSRLALIGAEYEKRFTPEPDVGRGAVGEGVVAIYEASQLFR